MSEPVRRNLLAGLKPREAATDEATVAAIAERHGFAKSDQVAPAPEPAPAPPERRVASPAPPAAKANTPALEEDEPQIMMRRRRKLRNRSQQFNVRLREDTIEAIYAESNRRDVPLAQVIEEMVDAFLAQKAAAPDA